MRLDDPLKQQLLEQRIAPCTKKRRQTSSQVVVNASPCRRQRGAASDPPFHRRLGRRNRASSPSPTSSLPVFQSSHSKESDSNSSNDIQMYFKPFQEKPPLVKKNGVSPVTPNGREEENWSSCSSCDSHPRQPLDATDAFPWTEQLLQWRSFMNGKDDKMSQLEAQLCRAKDVIRQLIVENEKKNRVEAKKWLDEQTARLGKLVVARQATGIREYWEAGSCFLELESRLADIERRMKVVDKEWIENGNAVDMDDPCYRFVKRENEAILAHRRKVLMEEEQRLLMARKALEKERISMMQEQRRQREECFSRFSDFSLLNHRYLLVKLIGKGGFSEVFKAYDLHQLEWVACKIHQLNQCWTEEQKSNYIRHTTREYEIHKTLQHPRIVKLNAVFEIDENAFCTVLEYCDGSDLDTYLKSKGSLDESEAKLILSQVLSGLVYLNHRPKKIIHYDLKPANILLKDGEVRIADFGLCKVVDAMDNGNDTTELTSQGAGTYWYLPPECFPTDDSIPYIGPKVDIWSLGVLFYQMLYGKKPFGHGLSQQEFVQHRFSVHGASHVVTFPSQPPVSEHAKDFLRRCLEPQVDRRWDVDQAASHPLLATTTNGC